MKKVLRHFTHLDGNAKAMESQDNNQPWVPSSFPCQRPLSIQREGQSEHKKRKNHLSIRKAESLVEYRHFCQENMG